MSAKPKRFKKFILYFLCWAISLSVGIYFRLYPLFLNVSDENYDKAAIFVFTKIRTNVSEQIAQKFPQATDVEKNKLVKQGIDYILHKDGDKFRYGVDKIAKDLEEKTPNRKRTPYLLEADPYNFYGLTQNIVNTGRLSDEIKGSKYFNKFMLAPLGHWEPLTLHPYIGYLTYKILSVFNPNISLMYAVGFTPLIITAFALVFFFLVCYLFDCQILSSLIGALFFVLAPIFLRRTAFGWYDNDPYNILFPLMILGVFFLGLERREKLKPCLFFAILCAFLISLYALFWQGWVYLLVIIFMASIIILFYSRFVLKNKKEAKNLLWFLAITHLGCFIGVSAFVGINDFFTLFQEGWKALKNFLTPELTSWPDIYIGVGELRKAPILESAKMIGNFFYIALSLLGFFAYVAQLLRCSKKADAYKLITLSIFFISCLFLAWGAQRFIILLFIPLSLFFVFGLQFSYTALKNFFDKRYPTQKFLVPFLSVFIITVFFVKTLKEAHDSIIVWRPIFNETWDKALTKIKNETPPNSIINSWWPPGHFITSMAKRRVTFDGATINNPQAYWLANVFLSPDESYAAGILRMLNNSANQACEYLQNSGLKLSVAVKKLKEIAKLNRSKAQKALKDVLTYKQTNELLELTHQDPPPSYVFIYDDLVEKNLELSFVGKWNFEAVEKIQGDKKRLAELPARNSSAYIRFLWNLADGPYMYSETLNQINQKSNMVFLANDIIVNLADMTCRMSSKKFGTGIPLSIIYLNDNNEVTEKEFSNANLGVSLLFYKEDNLYKGMVVDRRLATSLLFRLYFFDGKGFKYFKPFLTEKDMAGRTKILVFQIDWEKFKKDLSEK